jgi:DNA-binding MarR family transcriptional regulator
MKGLQLNQEYNDIELVNIPQKMFFPYRMLIMKMLYNNSEIYFQTIKNELRLTEGNLVSHLRALESEGLVTFRKEVSGKRVKTINRITPKGRKVYEQFRDIILKILKD